MLVLKYESNQKKVQGSNFFWSLWRLVHWHCLWHHSGLSVCWCVEGLIYSMSCEKQSTAKNFGTAIRNTLVLAESTCSCEVTCHMGFCNCLERKLCHLSKAKPSICKNYSVNVQFLDLSDIYRGLFILWQLSCILKILIICCHISKKSFRNKLE